MASVVGQLDGVAVVVRELEVGGGGAGLNHRQNRISAALGRRVRVSPRSATGAGSSIWVVHDPPRHPHPEPGGKARTADLGHCAPKPSNTTLAVESSI